MGIVSLFLIARSACAFVNYDPKGTLHRAVNLFNGVLFRSKEGLVCRIRKKEDDMKAGVGGQQVVGMHKSWVERRYQQNADDTEASGNEDAGRESFAWTIQQ